ncbi:MAG TPA: glycosyltransferase family 9 protein [Chthoniobacterales bacterium]|jgi:heptosyltransferase-2
MAGRILIIRGGAIGDFILTLPAIGLIRQNLPEARIEILGYSGIASLALSPEYADAVHSIEYGPLARFFSRRPTLDPEMVNFFTGYQQIISYLYDPDGIFEGNLRTAGVKNLLTGPGKLSDDIHAIQQLARPLEKLAFFLEEKAASFSPSSADLEAAASTLDSVPSPFIALHPGSGGKKKNWSIENWQQLIRDLQDQGRSILLVGGEADDAQLGLLAEQFQLPLAKDLPLRILGAVLSRSHLFVGHDSGISHLAAAAGARCILLFGPTDPDIWGPQNPNVEIVVSPDGMMEGIPFEQVAAKLQAVLSE